MDESLFPLLTFYSWARPPSSWHSWSPRLSELTKEMVLGRVIFKKRDWLWGNRTLYGGPCLINERKLWEESYSYIFCAWTINMVHLMCSSFNAQSICVFPSYTTPVSYLCSLIIEKVFILAFGEYTKLSDSISASPKFKVNDALWDQEP